MLDKHHRTEIFAVAPGDPAKFAAGVEVTQEFRGNLSDERLKFSVKAVLLSVERAVTRHDPTHIAGAQVMAQRHLSVTLKSHCPLPLNTLSPPMR